MLDTKRFEKIRSFQDIKLEKAKLRYEMLMAEKNLVKSMHQTSTFFTIGAIMSRFNRGLNTALTTYSMIANFFSKRKKPAKSKDDDS